MAKSKRSAEVASTSPMDDQDWQTRMDVDRLMSADEVHRDPKRAGRAMKHLDGVVDRLHKRVGGRTSRRSGGRR